MLKSDSGFSLVELLVSLVILTVGLLGLLQVVGVASEHIIRNQLRDEAVRIGETEMAGLQVRQVSQLTAASPFFGVYTAARNLRGAARKFTVTRQRSATGSGSLLLTVQVDWKFKEQPVSHRVQAMKSE